MDVSSTEYQESNTIRFEWTLRNLKSLFEGSKGDSKSKVTKSIRFGSGRWQVLFYANAGSVNSDGQTFVSLYLSCEPTVDELDSAIDGKWVREGLFKFGFELRNLQRMILFNSKEAHDHSFSYRTQNWGWAQFARRDSVYYQANTVRLQDAFVIICTISSSPSAPIPPPVIPRRPVPKDLLDSIGNMLDDPVYSDIEFFLPRRGRGMMGARVIYAARRLLKRVEYFDTMFYSGFAEGTTEHGQLNLGRGRSIDVEMLDETTSITRQFEDSDDEDDDYDILINSDNQSAKEESRDVISTQRTQMSIEAGPSDMHTHRSWISVIGDEPQQGSVDPDDHDSRNVRAKLSHPSSPRSRDLPLEQQNVEATGKDSSVAGPNKIYTDTIVFAPLCSSFFISSTQTPKVDSAVSASDSQASLAFGQRTNYPQSEGASSSAPTSPRSRREWLAQWERSNDLGRPRPCSAKAVYRLADRLDLQELKQRARQHIVKSLTVDNVAYEVFSTFSAAFEDVRKVQVRFFLDHWSEIRGSDSMRNVWQQIRLGRHPGFEEVWPLIAQNLEFKPEATESAGGDGKDSSSKMMIPDF